MQVSDFRIETDNSDKVIDAKNEAVERALEAMGQLAENLAKSNITAEGRVDTGRLRSSITHTSKDDTVYIGTNVEYAVYNEVGTGIYLDPELGTGRQTPWRYVDQNGVGHVTRGMKPIHFLKNAIQDHVSEYKELAERELEKG